MFMATMEKISFGHLTRKRCLSGILLAGIVFCSPGCLPTFYRNNVDITSDCVAVDEESYGFALTGDFSAVLMKGGKDWILLVPRKYIGEIPPHDEPDAQMFARSEAIREVKSGTRFKVLRIVRGLDAWGYPGKSFHLCTMTIELDTPDKFRCEMPSNAFSVEPFHFFEEFARPVQ
jgi:hypothetical protein